LPGCGKKADEKKPIAEAKAEAEKMSVKDLRAMATAYKNAITDKKAEVEKLAAKLKEIPMMEKLGEKAKKLSSSIESLNKSVSALTERYEIYYNKLKEKGGDTSGLGL
jgi:chromosome segregation ATPase